MLNLCYNNDLNYILEFGKIRNYFIEFGNNNNKIVQNGNLKGAVER